MENPFDTIDRRLQSIEALLENVFNNTQDNSLKQKELLSLEETSDFLNLSKKTLYNKVCKQEIQAIKKSKKLYFEKSYLIEWLKSGSPKQQVKSFLKGKNK